MILASRRSRVPYVPQMELAECGAACLSMVLGFHGYHLPLSEARRACGVSRDGASAFAVAKAAEAHGLVVEAVRVASASELPTCDVPAILHWKGHHFVVLERVTRRGAWIVDPASGRREVDHEELGASVTGLVLTFSRGPDFVTRASSSPIAGGYLRTLVRYAPTLSLLLVVSLLFELVGLVFPAASQVLIDFVIRPRRTDVLWIVAAVLGGAAISRVVLMVLRDQAGHVLNHLLDLASITRLVRHLQRLPHEFFQYRTTGDLLSRLSGVVELRGMSFRVLALFIEGLVVISCTGLMLVYDVRLGLLVLLLSVVRVAVVAALQGYASGASTRERVHRGHETAALVEALAVPELTRAPGVQRRLFERYTTHLRARLLAALDRRRISEAGSQLTLVVDGLQHALLLWIGGTRTLSGEISLGVLVAFTTLGTLLQRPMEALIGTLAQLGRATSILARMDDVLETAPEGNGSLAPSLEGRVALERVTFRYGHGGTPILDELSVAVAPGESVAIVGASGAGKSTLAKLLVGLLEPTSGTVRIDGHDLRELDRAHLRRHSGVVLQDTFLLEDTIGANLSLANPALPLEDLREAARLACVAEVIDALPRGYETLLGPHGHRMSGGQRQRLAIARALASRPRLLVLDEATSSLDLETEARVHANISALKCTRVIVAHRLATVRNVDRIVVLENGRIAQQGSYEELAGQPGLFREMVRTLEVAA